ncbi:unnamed protein product [Rotaria sp. Silwood2]|nr:unnamed protein product [Rotaria sp. Silwood2]
MQLLNADNKEVFSDQVQNHPMIRHLLNPIEQELKNQTNVAMKVIDLRKIASEQHAIAHHNLHPIADQRALIQKYLQETYPEDYQYKTELKKNGGLFYNT